MKHRPATFDDCSRGADTSSYTAEGASFVTDQMVTEEQAAVVATSLHVVARMLCCCSALEEQGVLSNAA